MVLWVLVLCLAGSAQEEPVLFGGGVSDDGRAGWVSTTISADRPERIEIIHRADGTVPSFRSHPFGGLADNLSPEISGSRGRFEREGLGLCLSSCGNVITAPEDYILGSAINGRGELALVCNLAAPRLLVLDANARLVLEAPFAELFDVPAEGVAARGFCGLLVWSDARCAFVVGSTSELLEVDPRGKCSTLGWDTALELLSEGTLSSKRALLSLLRRASQHDSLRRHWKARVQTASGEELERLLRAGFWARWGVERIVLPSDSIELRLEGAASCIRPPANREEHRDWIDDAEGRDRLRLLALPGAHPSWDFQDPVFVAWIDRLHRDRSSSLAMLGLSSVLEWKGPHRDRLEWTLRSPDRDVFLIGTSALDAGLRGNADDWWAEVCEAELATGSEHRPLLTALIAEKRGSREDRLRLEAALPEILESGSPALIRTVLGACRRRMIGQQPREQVEAWLRIEQTVQRRH